MTIDEKRERVFDYCHGRLCTNCKLDGMFGICGIDAVTEDDFEEAVKAIESEKLALVEEENKKLQNYCQGKRCEVCLLEGIYDNCGTPSMSAEDRIEALNIIEGKTKMKIATKPNHDIQKYQDMISDEIAKMYKEGIANPGLVELCNGVQLLKELHNGKFEEDKAREIISQIFHSVTVYCCTQNWSLKEFITLDEGVENDSGHTNYN